jgi:hypothetical protein
MNEFALIFRNEQDPAKQFSPEQMQDVLTQWRNWIGGIAAQNKLANPGHHLGFESAVISKGGVVTDGPYAELKEMLTGILVVRTVTIQEAIELGKGCPIFNAGGTVEVRNVIPTNME